MSNILKKINAIASAGAIEKSGKMTAAGQYNYHSIDGVVDYLRKQFKKHKMTLTYSVESCDVDIRENGAIIMTKELRIVLTCLESGETVSGSEVGIGIDRQDKSSGKATSYALKTFLTATFMLKGQPDENDEPVPIMTEKISGDRVNLLRARVAELGVDVVKFLKAAESKSFEEIPKTRFAALNKMLDMKASQ